jgi:hypothetical protein
MCAPFGMGYAVTPFPLLLVLGFWVHPFGPGSLWLAYAVNVIDASGWLAGTTLNGMPYASGVQSPRSGCRCAAEIAYAVVVAMLDELTSTFHALVGGKI